MKHTITFAEVQKMIARGTLTFSKKDNSVRGCSKMDNCTMRKVDC